MKFLFCSGTSIEFKASHTGNVITSMNELFSNIQKWDQGKKKRPPIFIFIFKHKDLSRHRNGQNNYLMSWMSRGIGWTVSVFRDVLLIFLSLSSTTHCFYIFPFFLIHVFLLFRTGRTCEIVYNQRVIHNTHLIPNCDIGWMGKSTKWNRDEI